ncbi:MAG: glycosyltransferase family 4 protein [Pseudomonadota bacterium]
MILFAVAIAALAAALTWVMARWRVLIDVPGPRSSHAAPTPRGGGVGIVVASAAGAVALGAGGHLPGLGEPAAIGLMAGSVVVAVAGLADDIRIMSSAFKLAVQALAAAIAVAAGLVVDTLYLPFVGPVELGPAGTVLTMLWFVGLTNAFNFMDGLDGLAGITAALAGAFLALAGLALGQASVSLLALVLAAASLGFLAFNFPPARVFMGDVGSQFLGFAFAGLGVLIARDDPTGTLVLIVPLLLLHFIFDTAFTWARRLARGEKLTAAHRSHLYQLLNQSGFSHRRVTLLHAGLTAAQGLGALLFVAIAPAGRPAVVAAFALVQAIYALYVLRRAGAGAA